MAYRIPPPPPPRRKKPAEGEQNPAPEHVTVPAHLIQHPAPMALKGRSGSGISGHSETDAVVERLAKYMGRDVFGELSAATIRPGHGETERLRDELTRLAASGKTSVSSFADSLESVAKALAGPSQNTVELAKFVEVVGWSRGLYRGIEVAQALGNTASLITSVGLDNAKAVADAFKLKDTDMVRGIGAAAAETVKIINDKTKPSTQVAEPRMALSLAVKVGLSRGGDVRELLPKAVSDLTSRLNQQEIRDNGLYAAMKVSSENALKEIETLALMSEVIDGIHSSGKTADSTNVHKEFERMKPEFEKREWGPTKRPWWKLW